MEIHSLEPSRPSFFSLAGRKSGTAFFTVSEKKLGRLGSRLGNTCNRTLVYRGKCTVTNTACD